MISNGHEKIDPNNFIFVTIKTHERTTGHEFTLVKQQRRLQVRNYSFSQRTVMRGIHCQLIMCILVVLKGHCI